MRIPPLGASHARRPSHHKARRPVKLKTRVNWLEARIDRPLGPVNPTELRNPSKRRRRGLALLPIGRRPCGSRDAIRYWLAKRLRETHPLAQHQLSPARDRAGTRARARAHGRLHAERRPSTPRTACACFAPGRRHHDELARTPHRSRIGAPPPTAATPGGQRGRSRHDPRPHARLTRHRLAVAAAARLPYVSALHRRLSRAGAAPRAAARLIRSSSRSSHSCEAHRDTPSVSCCEEWSRRDPSPLRMQEPAACASLRA